MSIVSLRVSREEETAFSRTLMKGIAHFQKRVASLENGSNTLSGEDAFQLYDTYGFPLDLTQARPPAPSCSTCLPACLLLLVASHCIASVLLSCSPEVDLVTLRLQLMAEEAKLQVDSAGFERCMQQQKEQSRKARKVGAGGALKFEAEATAYLATNSVPRTDDRPK